MAVAEISTGLLTDVLLQGGTAELDSYRRNRLEPLEHMNFADYILSILEGKGVSRSKAVANSGLEVHYAYQILSGVRQPKRDKILCLCIGGGLSLQETDRALERAAVGRLYPKRLRDAVIMLALNSGLHTVWEVNELLAEQGQELLG